MLCICRFKQLCVGNDSELVPWVYEFFYHNDWYCYSQTITLSSLIILHKARRYPSTSTHDKQMRKQTTYKTQTLTSSISFCRNIHSAVQRFPDWIFYCFPTNAIYRAAIELCSWNCFCISVVAVVVKTERLALTVVVTVSMSWVECYRGTTCGN